MATATKKESYEGTWTRDANHPDEWCVKILSGASRHFESKAHKMAGASCWVTSRNGKKSRVILKSAYVLPHFECGAAVFIATVDHEATEAERAAYFAAKKAA